MPQVIAVRDLEGLDAHYLVWKSLFGSTAGATFAQSPDYWRTLFLDGAGVDPLILVVVHGHETLGIVPLVNRQGTLHGGPLCPALPWSAIGRQTTVTMLAAWKWLAAEFGAWTMLDLDYLGLPQSDRGRTLNTLQLAEMEPEVRWQTRGFVQLEGAWFQYLESRDRQLRNQLRWSEHKTSLHGQLTFVRQRPAGKLCDDAEPRWDLYDACLQIGAESSSARIPAAAIHEAAASAGALDLAMLALDGKPLAFQYALANREQLHVVARGAVAPATAGIDPEINLDALLLWNLLADSWRQADRMIDLGPVDDITRVWITERQVVESYRFRRRQRWFPSISVPRWWESWTRT